MKDKIISRVGKPEFNIRAVHVGFVVEKVEFGHNFSHSTSDFPFQYHSTIAPYSFIHLPHTLYNVFLPVVLNTRVSVNTQEILRHTVCYPTRL
jgi:hypothetical protein